MMNKVFKLLVSITLIVICSSIVVFGADSSVALGNISESDKAVEVNFAVTGLESSDDVTILVYKKNTNATEPTQDNIVYINQVSADNSKISFNLLSTAADGRYEVRMGGTGIETVSIGSFYITSVIYGDVNNDGLVDSRDAVFVMMKDINLKLPDAVAPYIQYGDVNDDGFVDSRDAVYIMMKDINLELPDGILIGR